jgi:hypothetical protein
MFAIFKVLGVHTIVWQLQGYDVTKKIIFIGEQAHNQYPTIGLEGLGRFIQDVMVCSWYWLICVNDVLICVCLLWVLISTYKTCTTIGCGQYVKNIHHLIRYNIIKSSTYEGCVVIEQCHRVRSVNNKIT